MVWKINTQPNHTIHIPSKVHCCNFCDLYLVPNGSMSSSSWSDLQCSTTRRVHDRDGGGPSVSGGWGASCRQNSSRCQPRISTRNESHVFSNKLYSNLIPVVFLTCSQQQQKHSHKLLQTYRKMSSRSPRTITMCHPWANCEFHTRVLTAQWEFGRPRINLLDIEHNSEVSVL